MARLDDRLGQDLRQVQKLRYRLGSRSMQHAWQHEHCAGHEQDHAASYLIGGRADPVGAKRQRQPLDALRLGVRDYLEIGVRRGRSMAMVASQAPDCSMLGFDLWVHAPIDSSNSLHQTDRVPMDVVVDQAAGVLKIEALGEDVS